MATRAFSRMGWAALARSFVLSDPDFTDRIAFLLLCDRTAYPVLTLPTPLIALIDAERSRIDR